MEIFLNPETWLALLTLTFFEVVLGIDNIIFISIVSNRLPPEIRAKTRNIGLMLAMGVRILLLLTITWVMKFKEPLFGVPHWISEDSSISGRDLILIFGGMFLIAKSTREINHQTEGDEETLEADGGKKKVNISGIIVQIIILDIIFSFDSILTAVGLTDEVIIMIIAVVLSIGIMIVFSGKISDFIQKHPSMEVLALGFLILIGFMIFLEGLDKDIPKGYIYFAVVFSMLIEMVNIKVRDRRKRAKAEAHE
ncbi:MAG TPA: TerC family protein [Chryseosolibacter sp.]|nr:TerC family protein [Chryseosolibacter sp.]